MRKKRNRRKRRAESTFEIYNGSAVLYCTARVSKRSIAKICSTGTTTASGVTIGNLIDEVRK